MGYEREDVRAMKSGKAKIDPAAFKPLWIGLSLLAASCGGRESGTPELRIAFEVPAGWETHVSRPEIVRLRRKSGEALVDLSVHVLGPGGAYPDIHVLYSQYAHVGGTSRVDEESEVSIDGVKGKRIRFSGRRADTGVPNAGMRYVLRSESKGYVFEFLAAGDEIEAARSEAQVMIERIRFRK